MGQSARLNIPAWLGQPLKSCLTSPTSSASPAVSICGYYTASTFEVFQSATYYRRLIRRQQDADRVPHLAQTLLHFFQHPAIFYGLF
jgi:hypothetical protein